MSNCLLYYVTDRNAFPGDDHTRRRLLLDKIGEASSAGVDYIQLREKDLPIRELESLAGEAVRIIRNASKRLKTEKPELSAETSTALLINSRTDVALATGAAGVHLPAGDIHPEGVRKAWRCSAVSPQGSSLRDPLIGVSSHSAEEVAQAAADGAAFAVFAPVFEKKDAPGSALAGLDALRQACRAKIPVLALGGITLQNAKSCLQAGASGIAAIRLFQENEIAAVVHELRSY